MRSLFRSLALSAEGLLPATVFEPLAKDTKSSVLNQAYSSGSLSGYVNALFTIAIEVGAMVAVLQLVRAGYLYMLTDNVSLKIQAKDILADVALGLCILLSVWLILNQINPQILNLDIHLGAPLGTPPT